MKALYLTACLLSCISYCYPQSDTINWNQGSSWRQIRDRALNEKKAIFVDCYATWCGPCKLMDAEVFTKQTVIEYLNKNFICVKMQMDTAKNDNADIKRSYEDAHAMKVEHLIKSLPTYLFFTSSGNIVHRAGGALRDSAFLKVLVNALDTNRQYYTLLRKFKAGVSNYESAKYLARLASGEKEADLAKAIARDYLDNYLYKHDPEMLGSKSQVEFLRSFLETSKEKGFTYFLKYTDSVNKLAGMPNFAENKIVEIITKEELSRQLWNGSKAIDKKPDWKHLYSTIERKYGRKYALPAILNSQIQWYRYHQNWENLARSYTEKWNLFGIDTSGLGPTYVNNDIWDVFVEHVTTRDLLRPALVWMKKIVDAEPNDPQYLDTYAHLLYKLGYIRDAIVIEEKALSLKPDDNDIKDALVRMRQGK